MMKRAWWKPAVAAGLVWSLSPGATHAQSEVRYTVDPSLSLAWWQIDPNYGHLWATTCPDDPSWQAGDGRSPGTNVNYEKRQKTVASGHHAERIPMYPRGTAEAVCRQAVSGEVTVTDTSTWSVSGGRFVILPDSLITGLNMRDTFARRSVFETRKYPTLEFAIDSVTAVEPGDTIRALAHGTMTLRGVSTPHTFEVQGWPEAGGLRVVGQTSFNADDLTDIYGMSKMALGMGVTLGRWDRVYMGIDAVLRPSN